jgi:glycerol-3-phosphate dehydrogenase (NAD(P)+)
METIGIIGGGAWGTALAVTARRAGRRVILQAREPDVVRAVNDSHQNPLFLSGVDLDPGIRATSDAGEAAEADAVLLVVPAQHLRAVCSTVAKNWTTGIPAIICAKGIEQGSLSLMSEIVTQVLPRASVAVLSGPTFAGEVARGLPAAVTLACGDDDMGEALSRALGNPRFRIYRTDDLVGAQIGGAVKNVLAIACGIVEGRGLGENTRAALITRGLAEIARLGLAKKARPETLMGLSGIGDLTLTCNAMQSRNFSLGVELGRGLALDAILAARQSVAEGVPSASSVTQLAGELGVEMPICAAVDAVLNEGADIDATIAELLARPFKAETLE